MDYQSSCVPHLLYVLYEAFEGAKEAPIDLRWKAYVVSTHSQCGGEGNARSSKPLGCLQGRPRNGRQPYHLHRDQSQVKSSLPSSPWTFRGPPPHVAAWGQPCLCARLMFGSIVLEDVGSSLITQLLDGGKLPLSMSGLSSFLDFMGSLSSLKKKILPQPSFLEEKDLLV